MARLPTAYLPMNHILLSVIAALLLSACTGTTPTPAAIESSTLLRSSASWDATPYHTYPPGQPELTIRKLHIPANTALDWHSHPVPSAGYLLSGQLVVQARDSNHTTTLNAGDALAEMVDISHRGVTGNEPAELIVFHAGTPTMPLTRPDIEHASAMQQLVQAISERLALATPVALAKWHKGTPVADAERERQVIATAQTQGAGLNLPPVEVQQLMRAQIEASKQVQRTLHEHWRAAGTAPEIPLRDLAVDIRPQLDQLQARLLQAFAAFAALRDKPGCQLMLAAAVEGQAGDPLHARAMQTATEGLCIASVR